jgi:hypothetical protein
MLAAADAPREARFCSPEHEFELAARLGRRRRPDGCTAFSVRLVSRQGGCREL